MRVDALNRIHEVYKSQSTKNIKKTNKTNGADQVELSSTAKDFNEILKMLTDVPDIRQDKVDDLRNQINSGTYNVRSEEVAKKIMSQFDIKG